MSQVDLSHAATVTLSGGAKQASWSQSLGPQTLTASANTLDLRQLPEPQTLVFNGVDNIDDSVDLDLASMPTDASGNSLVKTIVVNGGIGGYDTLRVEGKQFHSVVYTATGKDSGIITYSTTDDPTATDLTIIFTGLEPVEDYNTADYMNIIVPDDNDYQLYAVDGTPHNGQDTINVFDANGNFENITFANKHGLWIQGGTATTRSMFPA